MHGLLLGWSTAKIHSETGVKTRTIQSWRTNLLRFQSMNRPPHTALGRRRKLTKDEKEALKEALLRHGWMMQDEMAAWLANERGVEVSRSTVSRLLKEEGWSRKKIARISRTRNEALRMQYQRFMCQFSNDDVVHLDESNFNEKTGWRHYGYAPIGEEARYSEDVRRGKTWSICGALTVDGMLCTEIKRGYFDAEHFLEFVSEKLIPALQAKYGATPVVVVMDNCSVHVNHRVQQLIESAGYQLQYLPPYSPDFNPIELVWSVLKAWIRRWYFVKRRVCTDFGRFLRVALEQSQCDRYARAQYSHTAGGIYMDREKLENLQALLRQYERGHGFEGLAPAEDVEFDDREVEYDVGHVEEEELLLQMLRDEQ